MASKHLLIILTICLFSNCSNNSSEVKPSNNQEEDTTVDQSATKIDSTSSPQSQLNHYVLEGSPDGPDGDFYFSKYDENSYPENYDVYTSISIIPDFYSDEDYHTVMKGMTVIARDGFRFYYELEKYSGDIEIYYDQAMEKLAANFTLINGKPDGICSVYGPDGSLYIERVYNAGEYVYSGKEPFANNWTFEPASSSLNIIDTVNAIATINNDVVYEIMNSKAPGENNYLEKILEKNSLLNPFQINGTVFTGKLMGYYHPEYYNHKYNKFELNFKDGWLDGDVKIYTWWGDLELHEIFEDGNLTETVYVVDPSQMDGVAKPIIYCYPEEKTEIHIELDFEGNLTHTYPKYTSAGWTVTAYPDGTLIDKDKKEYYALYWEGIENIPLEIPNGTVLKGNETIAFLESELPKMGLSPKETNEFIIYWLPQLENNHYNLIHFSSEDYDELARLKIHPKPETLIRVMMVFQPLKQAISIEPQDLSKLYKIRKGFTVVEWGGRKLNKIKL